MQRNGASSPSHHVWASHREIHSRKLLLPTKSTPPGSGKVYASLNKKFTWSFWSICMTSAVSPSWPQSSTKPQSIQGLMWARHSIYLQSWDHNYDWCLAVPPLFPIWLWDIWLIIALRSTAISNIWVCLLPFYSAQKFFLSVVFGGMLQTVYAQKGQSCPETLISIPLGPKGWLPFPLHPKKSTRLKWASVRGEVLLLWQEFWGPFLR